MDSHSHDRGADSLGTRHIPDIMSQLDVINLEIACVSKMT